MRHLFAGRPLLVDLIMVTYGFYLEYLCLMALPSYLIYLCLYQMPSEAKLTHFLAENKLRYCDQAQRTYPWRMALYKITPKTSGTDLTFHYALELNAGPWFWPRWRKIFVGNADTANHFLKSVPSSLRPHMLPAQRIPNHVYVDGVRQSLHMGAFTIGLVLLLNVSILWLYF
jgi:hypothetical protein